MDFIQQLDGLIIWAYAGLIIAGGYFLRMFNFPKTWPMKYIVAGWAVLAGVLYYIGIDAPKVEASWFITYFVSTSGYELFVKQLLTKIGVK